MPSLSDLCIYLNMLSLSHGQLPSLAWLTEEEGLKHQVLLRDTIPAAFFKYQKILKKLHALLKSWNGHARWKEGAGRRRVSDVDGQA